MEPLGKKYRPVTLVVLNKLIPYLEPSWSARDNDNHYQYDWDYLDVTNNRNLQSVINEDAVLRLLEEQQIITTHRKKRPRARIKGIPRGFGKNTVLTTNFKKNPAGEVEIDWTLYIEKIDHNEFIKLIEDLGLEFTGAEVIERPLMDSTLSPVKKRIPRSFFCVHTNNEISYRGSPIILEGQQQRVASIIMLSTKPVAAYDIEVELKIARAASKYVSELQRAFENKTNKKDVRYFDYRNGGYVFVPDGKPKKKK
jgi:hypothetical protein